VAGIDRNSHADGGVVLDLSTCRIAWQRLLGPNWPLGGRGVEGLSAQFFGCRRASAVHERDDEHLLGAQLIDDAPGVHGEFADILIVELRYAPTDAGRGGKLCGALMDLPCHGFGVEG
jgi:hypothetical protein